MSKIRDVLNALNMKQVRKSDDTIQLQFELNPEKAQEIEEMMDEMGFESQEQFFNFAIALVSWALEEREEGNIIASVHGSEADEDDVEIAEAVQIPSKRDLSPAGAT